MPYGMYDNQFILNRASSELIAQFFKRYNFTFIAIDVSEFIQSGGSMQMHVAGIIILKA